MTPPPARFGVGFRAAHFDEIVAAPGAVDWLEVIADTYIGVGGVRRARLERLRADHPIALHGVSLSIAGDEPLPHAYLRGLRELIDRIDPVAVSDHLCWTSHGGHQSHDLLPVAYTAEVLDHVAERVARVQDLLGRRLLLENATAYVAFQDDELDEAGFFAELGRRTGCGMLLDVNNLFVNAVNLALDPVRYLATIPAALVGYMHLAGHAVLPDVRIDTHDAAVAPPVWALFDRAARRFPAAGVIIERDDALPPFARLVEEANWARNRHRDALARGAAPASPPAAAARMPGPARPWRALREAFWRRVVDQPVGVDHAADESLAALLADDRPVTAARGMRVYSDSYRASLRDALATNFPALARVVSATDFDRLAAAYLRAHPPTGHGFRSLGTALAAFVRAFPFGDEYGVPPAVLAELVALEQAQLEVADGPDEAAAVMPAHLTAIAPADWEGVRFAFSPALRIVRASHDVLPVIDAVERGAPPDRPERLDVTYLVCRSEGLVHTERLSAREACILAALAGGASFGAACRGAVGQDDDPAAAAVEGARVLVTAAQRGLVTRIEAAAAA